MNTSDPWDYSLTHERLMDIYEDIAITLDRVTQHKSADKQLDTDLKMYCSDWKDKLTEIIEDLEEHL